MAGESLCTVSIAIASWLYSLRTVIKILPMSGGTLGVSSGGGNFCVCQLNLHPTASVRRSTTTCLFVRARDYNLRVEPVFRSFPLQLTNFLKEEYKVEPSNAY